MSIKCPICESQNLLLTELWKDHYIEFSYMNGKIKQLSMGEGNPYKVHAICKGCTHSFDTGLTQIEKGNG